MRTGNVHSQPTKVAPIAHLQLTLLGGFHVRAAGGLVIDVATRKTRALLAYLALPPGRQHTREALVSLLWSDRGEKQAHASLRQALVELGRALECAEGTSLTKHRDTLALDPKSVQVDAVAFEQLAAKTSISELERAATLYSGDLLAGVDVRDSAFEEWLLIERQRFRNMATTVLKQLSELQTGRKGIATAERLIALDPLQEEGYRMLMRLPAEAGEIGLALKFYENCRQVLKRELSVTPSAETEALHQEIREGRHRKLTREREVFSAPTAGAQARSPEKGAAARPTLAVLPFANLSGDPEQRYFSDGITDDLIIELSRFRSFTVIARNSSFLYRDKPTDVRQIGRELGAEYILEGSVRRASDRIRIAVELVEAATGRQVWAERYDRAVGDLFTVQDELIQAIVATLPGRMDEAGARAAQRKQPENLNAYECYLRGLAHIYEFDVTESPPAREMLERAVSLDPHFARPYTLLAVLELRHWWGSRSSRALAQAFNLAQKSVQLDQNDSLCQCSLGMVCLQQHQFADADFHFRRALALNPNDSRAIICWAELLAYSGEPVEAMTSLDRAFRLDPFAPQWYHSVAGMVLFCAREYEKAISSFGRGTRGLAPWDCLYVVASDGYLDEFEKAQSILAHYDSFGPTLPLWEHASQEPFKNEADLRHLLDGIRKVDIPD
jgi:TolB-like protein